MDMNTRIL